MNTENNTSTTTYLSQQQVYDVITSNRKEIQKKVKDGIQYKLRHNIGREDLQDLVSEAITNTVLRHHDGLIQFESEAKVIGYILFACWCNYRTQGMKNVSAEYKRNRDWKKVQHEEDWLREGAQMLTFDTYFEIRTSVVSLDNLEDADTHPAFAAQEPRDETDQDLTDAYYSELYQKLFNYLDDCVQDNIFKLEEVNLYKTYVLDNLTMKQLVAQSEFKQTFVYTAIKRIKTHLKTVDWNLRPRE
ncbi:hypothetical protein ASU33_13860 [Solirubrum puertoriconensis]|uniref:Uncharacterized protein n=2 Tax=Solirubrum puertoriconensis TaxID=1751427 RepID=A0A9X0L4B4_SOLP1|nr:hypothetical protein ASU33_13860 [Solirubrum puertoriconensis]